MALTVRLRRPPGPIPARTRHRRREPSRPSRIRLAGITALAAACTLAGGCEPTNHHETVDLSEGVPVAAVLSLSGSAEVYGQDQRIGLGLALEQINSNGGVNGLPIRLTVEDGASDDPGANAAFTTQIDRGNLALIGPTLSQQALSADPIAQRRGVPVVGPSNTATGIPQIGHFISRVSAQSSRIGPLAITRALQLQPEIRRVAVFYAHDDAYSTAETRIFQDSLAEQGLEPVTVQRTQRDEQNFDRQIRSALKERPELVVVSLQAVEGARLVHQLRQAGYKGLIVAGNGMNTPRIFPICKASCEGLLIAQAYSPELKTPANAAFLQLFRLEHGDRPPPQLTAQAFTALQVVGDALQRLDQRQPIKGSNLVEVRRALMDELLDGTYQTPLGEIRFSPEGEVLQKQFVVAQVKMAADGLRGRFAIPD